MVLVCARARAAKSEEMTMNSMLEMRILKDWSGSSCCDRMVVVMLRWSLAFSFDELPV